jgi:subtilisin-like proprotein convertase family protein
MTRTRSSNRKLLFWAISCALCVRTVILQVLDDSLFVDIVADWTSEVAKESSLVSRPVQDFVNDTAVTFVWELSTTDLVRTIASDFDIEISFGPYSEDYANYASVPVEVSEGFGNNSYVAYFTAAELSPATTYRFRVCPIFATGRGFCSQPLEATTLGLSSNYWEPVLARRLSLAASGRGFTNPAVQRPHLDTGVEVFAEGTSDNPLRFSDPTTSEAPVLPSGRRGHSLSRVDGQVFMFGGRTNGYGCATVYKDTLDLGNTISGRDVYPCVRLQAEVSEVWSFDVSTYQWVFLNVSKWQPDQAPPLAREQHSAAVVQRDVYVFGGKTRVFQKDATGAPLLTHHSDVVFSDLWKLSVERAQQYVLYYPNDTAVRSPVRSEQVSAGDFNASIPQTSRLMAKVSGLVNDTIASQSDGVTPREGLCIDKVVVRVKLQHPCLKQLRVSIMGPGPLSGSPNFFSPSDDHEVLLFSGLTTNGTGCAGGVHYFEFDDASNRLPETCCYDRANGTFRPQGRLAEFAGASMTADWTLVAQDLHQDQIEGVLLSWEVEFESSPCFRQYSWTNLTSSVVAAGANAPPARYAAHVIAHEFSLFVYGGRDEYDALLDDLYRYDTATEQWAKLVPVNFHVALDPASSVGASYALTAWGLIRFGGYYRQPTLAESYDNYDASVAVQDPVTLRWRELLLDLEPPLPTDTTFGRRSPSRRYLGATTFLPSHALHWASTYTHRSLYDQLLPSGRTNYAGSVADSLLLVGGSDGSTGSVYDGPSGGFLIDTWMLRLANWSTPGNRDRQQQYLEAHCRWRESPSALADGAGTESCLGASGANCEWRDLIMKPWCSMNNQSII